METFSSPDVYQHQGPSNIEEPFYEDARGFIQRVKRSGQEVNLLFTKQGFTRSGDLHQNIQYDFIFNGKIELWLRQEDGTDTKQIYGANSFIEIPAGIPHLFNFLEDTFMAEWWSGPFEAWYFRPYRKIIDKGLG